MDTKRMQNTLATGLDKLNPLAKKLAAAATNAQQYMAEQIGVASNVTELPGDYVRLEQQVAQLQKAYVDLAKIAAVHKSSGYDNPQHLQESMVEFGRTIGDRINTMANASHKPTPHTNEANKTLSHCWAKALNEVTAGVGADTETGKVCGVAAVAQEKVGDLRVTLDAHVVAGVQSPLAEAVNKTFLDVNKARKNVVTLRIALDALNSSQAKARGPISEAKRKEIETAEDDFVAAVEETSLLMRSMLDSAIVNRGIKEMLQAQKEYHAAAAAEFESAVAQLL